MKHFLLIALIALGINTSSASAQTLQESADFANLYCMQYFSSSFPGRVYQSVVVNRSILLSTNSIGMSGTVSFLDAFGLPKDNYFELVMTITPSNMIDVKFAKLNQVFGSQYWEYCNNSFPMQQQSTYSQPSAYQPSTLSYNTAAANLKRQEESTRMANEYMKTSWETSKIIMNNFR